MKTLRNSLPALGCVWAMLALTFATFATFAQSTPKPNDPAPEEEAADTANQDAPPIEEVADDVDPDDGAGQFRPNQGDQPDTAPEIQAPAANPPERSGVGSTGRRSATTSRTTNAAPPADPVGDGEKGLRLNFRGVPLEMVLNYLSDAAGFVINLETEVNGKVDVWSNRPLSRDEAVDLLNSVLKKNGYAAIRNGRTLTVVSREEARRRDIPVISGNNPDDIPRSDEMVTQIVPVRFINASQLTKDLQPLLPETASLTANEGGNALVITDTQSNIRRMVEIVQALDQAIASVSSVRVFPLRYADAKTLATTVTQLFQTQETSRGGNNQGGGGQGRFFAEFRRGAENAGGGAQGAAGSSGSARAPQPRVVAVADERSNSLVVSAPAEQMIVIAGVVEEVDTDVEDITEIRVYRLKHSDPQETADLLTELFKDNSTQQNNRGGRQGPRFGGGGGNNNNANQLSARATQETRVVAVPDLRTRSVVVTASRNLIGQITSMIEQLDEDPARKQKVFVYSVENTDPQAVQQVLQSLFPDQNTSLNRNSRNNQNQNESSLNNRQTQTRNQNTRATGTTFGGNSLGGTTGLGGGR